MLYYQAKPSNEDNPNKRLNLYPVDGHALSEAALYEHIRRMCEFVQSKCARHTRRDIERAEIWICTDWMRPGFSRSISKTLWPTFELRFLLAYSPIISNALDHMHDLCSLRESLASPRACPWYTNNRSEFARKLLQVVGQCWIETLEYWRRIEEAETALRSWQVKLWVHGQPDVVWGIGSDERLIQLSDHPDVDEEMINPVESESTNSVPPVPTDIHIETRPGCIAILWRPVPDVDGYQIEFSSDGIDFTPIMIMDSSKITLEKGLHCWEDKIEPEADTYYIRMRSWRGPISSLHLSSPSSPLLVT
jgi:hypothetical protein